MHCRVGVLLSCWLAPFALAQGDGDDLRCRLLSEAADRGAFDVRAAVAALDDQDEGLARTAAAIVRNEWVELPVALFEALAGKPRATTRLLEEFARAPRPAARAWVLGQIEAAPGSQLAHRLLALAARGEPLAAAEATLLVAALRTGEDGDAFHLVLPLVPEKVADGLLGRVHQGLLQEQFEVERVTYLLDRLSPRGTEILLGLVVTLPAATARVLCQRVHQNRPALVEERVAAALDGNTPLEPIWLEFAGPLLDRPERIARVRAVLKDGATAEVRQLAFEALVAGKVVDESVLAIAIDGDDGSEARIRRVLQVAAAEVPARRLGDWLHASPEVAGATAKALARRRALEPRLQRTMLDLLRDVEVVEGGVALDVLTALAVLGDGEALATVWPLVMGSRSWSQLLDRIGRRDEPFVYERLLAELVEAGDGPVREDRRRQLDMVRMLLVARGDRRELEALVAAAATATPLFLRRCRHYVDPLPVECVGALVDAAVAAEDPEVAAELLEWAATNRDAATVERIRQLWLSPPTAAIAAEELSEVALRMLATGPGRPALVAELRRALSAGPLPDRLASLPYELLGSMAQPMTADDVRLGAEIVLLPPLTDPEGEQRLVQRWPDGTFGFPLVAAVANRLRAADVAMAYEGFAALVAQLRDDPRKTRISRQRLKVFWRSLSLLPELQAAVGVATAPLWQFVEAADGVGDGSAWWLLARGAAALGDYPRAEQHYRRAIADLLRLPSARREARWLLGDRDQAVGDDPWSALAAAPHRMRYLSALAAGDPAAAAAAAQLVREFAGHDEATLATLNDPTMESGR